MSNVDELSSLTSSVAERGQVVTSHHNGREICYLRHPELLPAAMVATGLLIGAGVGISTGSAGNMIACAVIGSLAGYATSIPITVVVTAILCTNGCRNL